MVQSLCRECYRFDVMPSQLLPEILDLGRIQSASAVFESTLVKDDMTRLAEVGDLAGDVRARLAVSSVLGGELTVEISASATVSMVCQRCLEAVTIPLRSASELRVVEQRDWQEQDDTVCAPDWRLDVRALVEDELLLVLPAVPRHEDPPCREQSQHFAPPGETELPQRDNPFAVLRDPQRYKH